MNLNPDTKNAASLIRLSLLLLILPVMYLGIWISIATDDSLTYFEQVQLFMSYFPEPIRNPFWTTFGFFGLSLASASLSFTGYLKAKNRKIASVSMIICLAAALLSTWFGMTLL